MENSNELILIALKGLSLQTAQNNELYKSLSNELNHDITDHNGRFFELNKTLSRIEDRYNSLNERVTRLSNIVEALVDRLPDKKS